MSGDPYSARVRELFDAPAHVGCLGGELCAKVEDQGIRICLCAELAGGEIRSMRFRVRGCPHVIAAAEAVCADYEGRSSAELLEFSASDLMQSLSVPVEKTGRILVIEDAVRTLGSIVREASDLND